MTRVRRINVSQIEGDSANNTSTNEIRPYGELAVYVGDNNKLELLMFDGVRTHVKSKVLNKGTFYGGDADSSDGLNYDTIKLVPDEVLRRSGSDQYLVIDPTYGEPGHIHIRAGGTIDNSTADLFLGGELNNVRISDLGNYVQISADAGGEGATKQWRFDSLGGLTLPSSAGIIGQDGIRLWGQGEMSSTAYIGLPSNEDASSTYLTVGNYSSTGVLIQAGTTNPPKNFFFKGSGDLELPGTGKFIDTPTVTEVGTIITVPLNAAGDTEDYVGGASTIEIPKNADTNQVQEGWIITFSNDVQRTITGVLDGGLYWSAQYADANPGLGSSTYPLTIQSADYTQGSVGTLTVSKAGNITIASNYNVSIIADYTDTNRVWVFDGSDGSLRFPNNAVLDPSDSNIEFRLMDNFNVEAAGVVNIVTAAAGSPKSWVFEDDGKLIVPGAIKSKTTPATGTQVENLPYTLGAGADNGYVGIGVEWGAISALGNLTGYTLTAQQTGSTIFTTTITQMRDDLGGQPAFQTLDPLPGYAADITFTLTSPGYVSESSDDLELAAGTNTWTFDSETGDLTLPAGGDIKNSSGNSVLNVQGEYTFDFDGINTDVTITDLNFNLIYASTAIGYSGSDTHNINLPAGTPGQRLVIVNVSNFCTLTINNNQQITVASGPAEFIYSANDDWISMYGTV